MSKRKQMERYMTKRDNRFPGYWISGGEQIFTDEYSAISLSGESIDLDGFKERERIPAIEKFFSRAAECSGEGEILPSLSELMEKKRELRAEEKRELFQPFTDLWWHCNINFLISITEIIRKKGEDVYIYRPENRTAPMLLVCDENKAILLPVRVRTPEEEAKAEEERKRLEEEREAVEEEIRRAEERQAQKQREEINKAESDIFERKPVRNKLINGKSIILYLMERHSLVIPIKTKGWVNKNLREICFADGKITYKYSRDAADSKSFYTYLEKLETAIREKMDTAELELEPLPF